MDAGNERESTAPKRRESRAGTRKVTSLTAEQLDGKRANDREAQRTIRQRTKEHIESLEREVAELRAKTERFDEVVQRNAALDEEVRRLRHQLAIVTSSPAYPGNGKQGRHECRGPYKLLHCQKFFSHLRTGSLFGVSTNSPMQIVTCPIWPCFPRTTPDPLEERQIPSPVPPQSFIHHTTRYPRRSSVGKITALPRRLRWASRPSQTTQAVSNRISFTGSSSRPQCTSRSVQCRIHQTSMLALTLTLALSLCPIPRPNHSTCSTTKYRMTSPKDQETRSSGTSRTAHSTGPRSIPLLLPWKTQHQARFHGPFPAGASSTAKFFQGPIATRGIALSLSLGGPKLKRLTLNHGCVSHAVPILLWVMEFEREKMTFRRCSARCVRRI